MVKNSIVYPFVVGLLLMALGTSSKAIIDVAVLKAENKTVKELLHEVRADVKILLNKSN